LADLAATYSSKP